MAHRSDVNDFRNAPDCAIGSAGKRGEPGPWMIEHWR